MKELVTASMRRVRVVLWNVLGLVIIYSVILAVGLLHARYDGWSTPLGAVFGALFLFLFISPVVDWAIVWVVRASRSPWYAIVADGTRLASEVVFLGLLTAGLVTMWVTGSLAPMIEVAREALDRLLPG